MFNVFDGKGRGPGSKGSGYIQLAWDFRDIAQFFKGAKLSVFLMLMLHSDKEGRSWPSYAVLMKETGLSRETIAIALRELCEMSIDGCRVLLKYRSHENGSQYRGSNHYIIWPTPKEIAKWERLNNPSLQGVGIKHHRTTVEVVGKPDSSWSENPTPLVGKADLNYNHLTKSTVNINVIENLKTKIPKRKSKIQVNPEYQDWLDHHPLE